MQISILEILQAAQLLAVVGGLGGIFVRWGRMTAQLDTITEQISHLFEKDSDRDRHLSAIGERVARLEGRGNGGEEAAVARYRKEVSRSSGG